MLEDLGFCPKGEGGPFVEGGTLRLGGALPLNTDGGGLSSCHPGMRGIFLLIEAARQLRGEAGDAQVPDCELALAVRVRRLAVVHRHRRSSERSSRDRSLEAGATGASIEGRPLPLARPRLGAVLGGGRPRRAALPGVPGVRAPAVLPAGRCARRAPATPEWRQASGRGTVHTFTVIRQNWASRSATQLPYVVAMVELDEGPRMMANVTDCDPEDVRIGHAGRGLHRQGRGRARAAVLAAGHRAETGGR